jgi:TonB family protein
MRTRAAATPDGTRRAAHVVAALAGLVVGTRASAVRAQDAGSPAPSASSAPPASDQPASPSPSPSSSPPPASFAPGLVPPRLIRRAQPEYPAGADGRRVDVELLLTVDPSGAVSQVEVLGHIPADAPESFDIAARDAARTLLFDPARRDGVCVAVRVRFHMPLVPPVVGANASSEPLDDELGAGAEGITHSHTEGTQLALPSSPVAPSRGASSAPPDEAPAGGLTVIGHPIPPQRSASDTYTEITPGLRQVPRSNASDLLRLAPGILLTNEGGEGHAEQVYLRGFDAHEGQDLEFTVNGIPINEVGNPHGEGLVDTHFIIPELVRSIRVLEGPFDPHQGNYAVAGSAEYELGLDTRGISLRYEGGSFNTHRVLALWGPDGARTGTFAGADLRTTDGFGVNRAARLGRAMGQWELPIGPSGVLRVLGTAYASQYGTAGVIRQDDYDAGRIGFFGSYDPTQGGDSMRYGVSATYEDTMRSRTSRVQLFGTYRNFRLRENYTGFIEDPPEPYRSGIAQRGDLVDQNSLALTVGARASSRHRVTWRGLVQSFEAGLYGRFDQVDASQRRLRFGTAVPYRVDFDLTDSIGNVGLYVDADFHPARWFTLRGGVRGDYFVYDVLSHCDVHDTSLGARTPVDTLCYTRDRTGPRDPGTRRSASGLAIQPRGTVLVGPFAGFSFTASAGTGARSADPSYLADSSFAPFATVVATEGGVVFHREFGAIDLTLRAIYYFTHVGRDLIFNQQEGRNTLAPGTQRQGVIVAGRLSTGWLDWSASATYADARFVREQMDPGSTYFPVDQGNQVPYVPTLVVRSDAGLHGALPLRMGGDPLLGRAGLGITYVSPRALPYGQHSDSMFVVDASLGVRWRWLEIGAIAQNLLNARYQLGVYNYVSNFDPNNATPSLHPARHFTAGAPLSVFGTLTVYLGGPAGGGGLGAAPHEPASEGGRS